MKALPMEASRRIIRIVENVIRYIKSRPQVDAFFPQIVAKAISDSEAAAMLGLYLLEKKGIVKRHLAALCEKHSLPLEEHTDLCPACMERKSTEDESAYAETYFTIDRHALSELVGVDE
jgi:hypothetical protein